VLVSPLEAFSGEQAFAYTRARLVVLDEDELDPEPIDRAERVGAFIAHDRLAGLLAYLRERVGEHPEDQVLVVLPLSSDYAQLAETSLASEAERYRKLAGEITTRSYAVRLLEP
jgi:hypothetical protein